MPKRCTICSHEKTKEINLLILKSTSFRVISRQFWGDEFKHDSIRRHSENCLSLEISALIAEKKIENAVDAYVELENQLVFAKSLREAAKEYLTDENGNITLNPRAKQIQVVYEDSVDLDSRGNPKRKTSFLDQLIEKVETGGLKVEKTVIKSIDPHQYALNTISTINAIVDKFLKIEGLYTKERENRDLLDRTAKAICHFLTDHPDADKEEVIKVFGTARGIKKEDIINQLGMIN